MAENPAEDMPQFVTYTAEQLQALVHQALADQKASHDAEIAGLKTTVEALSKSLAGNVPTFTPEHSAGHGVAIHPTWSQYEQELAYAATEAARR